MAWRALLLVLLGPEAICAVRESVEELTEVKSSNGALERAGAGKLGGLRNESAAVKVPPDDEDEDEDESEDETKALQPPGKKHGEAKYTFKPATDGFDELDKVVESIDAAADDASTKAKRVDDDYAAYRGRMKATGMILDRLSLTGAQFKKEVVDYFADAETDRFSPLAERVPDRDFVPDHGAVEKLRVAEATEHPCQDPESFCCIKGLLWSEVRQRSEDKGCVPKKGECDDKHVQHKAVSRKAGVKDEGEGDEKGNCVPKEAARYFKKSSDWQDENIIEQSDLLSDLALVPEAENVLAEKLAAASTPKLALVRAACGSSEWEPLLKNAGVFDILCPGMEKIEGGEGEDDDVNGGPDKADKDEDE